MGPLNGITSIAAGGGLVAIARKASTEVELLDSASRAPRGRLLGGTAGMSRLVFAPDGKYLAGLGDDDLSVYVWDVAQNARPKSIKRSRKVRGVAAFAGGGRVAIGDEGGNLVVASVETGVDITTFPTQNLIGQMLERKRGDVDAVSVSPSEKYVAGVAGGILVMVVEVAAPTTIKSVAVQGIRVGGTSFSRDEQRLLAYAYDMSIRLQMGGRDVKVSVNKLAGGILVWDLASGESQYAQEADVMFENAYLSCDGARVIVIVNAPPADQGMHKSAIVLAREALKSGAPLPTPVETIDLGSGTMFASNTFDVDRGTLFLEQHERLEAWSIAAAKPAGPLSTHPAAIDANSEAPFSRRSRADENGPTAPSPPVDDWQRRFSGSGSVRARLKNASDQSLVLRVLDRGKAVAQGELSAGGGTLLHVPSGKLKTLLRLERQGKPAF